MAVLVLVFEVCKNVTTVLTKQIYSPSILLYVSSVNGGPDPSQLIQASIPLYLMSLEVLIHPNCFQASFPVGDVIVASGPVSLECFSDRGYSTTPRFATDQSDGKQKCSPRTSEGLHVTHQLTPRRVYNQSRPWHSPTLENSSKDSSIFACYNVLTQ